MTDEVEEVLFAGIVSAINSLPPRALGLRSHAIDTEEHASSLIRALDRIAQTHDVLAVIGRPSGDDGIYTRSGIEVLKTHAAASRATRLRNDSQVSHGRQLLYFNTESSPGESGLDGLNEVRPQTLALGFARTAGLPILERLAEDNRRQIVDRIEDATVQQLARYAKFSSVQDEGRALPLLGLLPIKLSTPHRVESLMQYSGTNLGNQLSRAAEKLQSHTTDAKEAIEARLREGGYIHPEQDCAFDYVLGLCGALRRFAHGLLDLELDELCGLSTRLVRLLRSGDKVIDRLLGPDDTGEIHNGSTATTPTAVSEPRMVELGRAEVLLAPIVDVDDELGHVTLQPVDSGEHDVSLRASKSSQFVLSAIQGDWGRESIAGCALRVRDPEGLRRGIPLDAEVTYDLTESALDAASQPVRDAVLAFRESREHLINFVESLFDEESPAIATFGGIGLLECFPLTCVSRAKDACADYVESYARLAMRLCAADPRASNIVEDWLLHLDVAFAVKSHAVEAARLLPLHPVRISRYLAWIEAENRPPPAPPNIVVTYKAQEVLQASETEDCYHRRMSVGPTDAGMAAACEAGLEQAWTLLAARRLVTALDIEVQGVSNPIEAVEALAQKAQLLFESDRSVGDWVTLVVNIAPNEDGLHPIPMRELRSRLGLEFETMLEMPRGEGLRLEIHPTTEAGAHFRHLVIQGVDTPYRNLPVDDSGTTLGA